MSIPSFGQYAADRQLDEIFDLSGREAEGSLKQNPNEPSRLTYDFTHELPDGTTGKYKVIFKAVNKLILSSPTSSGLQSLNGSFYGILFYGPQGTLLTKNSGMSAPVIYQKLLLAIKKLMSQEKVDGLGFTAAEGHMVLPYTRFIEKYLIPLGFKEVEDGKFVSQELIDSLDKEDRESLEWRAGDTASGRSEMVKSMSAVRSMARAQRRKQAAAPKIEAGKFYKNPWGMPVYLFRIRGDTYSLMQQADRGVNKGKFYMADKTDFTGHESLGQAETVAFLRDLASSPDDMFVRYGQPSRRSEFSFLIPDEVWGRYGVERPS